MAENELVLYIKLFEIHSELIFLMDKVVMKLHPSILLQNPLTTANMNMATVFVNSGLLPLVGLNFVGQV